MKFTKAILREGSYFATGADGKRTPVNFDASRLRKMAKTTNDMIKAGLRIPAPFNHNAQALPKISTDTVPDSYINAGYWEKFWISDEEGVPTLYGIIDAPGSKEDLNSPAGKIGATVKEVSLSVRPQYVDGANRTWKDDPILHVALCTHPVDYGTSDFKLADVTDFAVNLSSLVPGDDSSLGNLKAKLKEVANIFLPDNCTVENLSSYLMISLNQLALMKESKDGDDDFRVEPTPVFLSTEVDMQFSKEQAEGIVAQGVVNPATKKPYVLADFGFTETKPVQLSTPTVDPNVEQTVLLARALGTKLLQDTKAHLTRRINALVESKRVTQEYATATLLPQVAAINLSVVNGTIAPASVESLVDALEQIPAPVAPKPAGLDFGTVHTPDIDTNAELSDEDANKLVDQLVNFVN